MKVCLCSSRHCSEFLISGYVNHSFPGFMSIYYIIKRNDPQRHAFHISKSCAKKWPMGFAPIPTTNLVSDSPTWTLPCATRCGEAFLTHNAPRNCLTDQQQDCGYLKILSWRRPEISEIESEDDFYTTSPSAVPKNRTLFQLTELQTLMSPRKCVPFDRFFSSVKTPNDRLIQKNGIQWAYSQQASR